MGISAGQSWLGNTPCCCVTQSSPGCGLSHCQPHLSTIDHPGDRPARRHVQQWNMGMCDALMQHTLPTQSQSSDCEVWQHDATCTVAHPKSQSIGQTKSCQWHHICSMRKQHGSACGQGILQAGSMRRRCWLCLSVSHWHVRHRLHACR